MGEREKMLANEVLERGKVLYTVTTLLDGRGSILPFSCSVVDMASRPSDVHVSQPNKLYQIFFPTTILLDVFSVYQRYNDMLGH